MGINLSLNSLKAPGGAPLELQEVHQKRAQSVFSKHLLKNGQICSYLNTLTDFTFKVSRKGVEILAPGQTPRLFQIAPSSLSELRKLSRIPQFYTHIGRAPKQPEDPQMAALRKKAARTTVAAMNKAAIPGSSGKLLTVTAISENTLSLTRDVLRSIPQIGPQHALPHSLAFPAGLIWTAFGFREIKGGYQDLKRAGTISDIEGRNRAVGRVAVGALGTAGSLFFLAGKTAISANAPLMAASSVSFAGDVLFGIGSLIGIAMSSLGIHRCRDFRKSIYEYYENPNLSREEQVKGALSYFLDKLQVTEREQQTLLEEIDEQTPYLPIEEKAEIFHKKLLNLVEVKVKWLKRRTSHKSINLIANKVEPLLAKLANPETRVQAIEEARALIETVLLENQSKETLYTIGLVAAILSLIGVVLGTFFSLGTLPFILAGLASLVYLMMTAYNFIVQLSKKEPEAGPLLMAPLEAAPGGI